MADQTFDTLHQKYGQSRKSGPRVASKFQVLKTFLRPTKTKLVLPIISALFLFLTPFGSGMNIFLLIGCPLFFYTALSINSLFKVFDLTVVYPTFILPTPGFWYVISCLVANWRASMRVKLAVIAVLLVSNGAAFVFLYLQSLH
jgi:hypothetical protein